LFDSGARPVAGDAPEHQARDEPRARRVVEVKQSTDHFASPQAGYITGQTLVLDGGLTAA